MGLGRALPTITPQQARPRAVYGGAVERSGQGRLKFDPVEDEGLS